MSRTVARLSEGGLVEVGGPDWSAYRAAVRLTPAGEAAVAPMGRIVSAVLDRTGEALGRERREQMYESMALVLETLRGIDADERATRPRPPTPPQARPARPTQEEPTWQLASSPTPAATSWPGPETASSSCPSRSRSARGPTATARTSPTRASTMLVEQDELPTTGQVTPYDFGRAIEDAEAAGDEAVIVTLASGLSGTHQSAVMAAAGHSCARVFDSGSASVGERIQVERAVGLARSGMSADDIVAVLEAERGSVRVLALLDTLEYLRRGGRIPKAAAALGPVGLDQAGAGGYATGRSSCSARRAGPERPQPAARGDRKSGSVDFSRPVALGYTGNSDALLRKYLGTAATCGRATPQPGQLPVHTIGATIGTHAGPGAIGVAFYAHES